MIEEISKKLTIEDYEVMNVHSQLWLIFLDEYDGMGLSGRI